MQRVRLVLRLGLPSLLALGCASHGTGGPVRHADGSYELSCKGALRDCLAKAEHICRDEGYTVAEARDVHELLGNESGQSTVMIQKSDATIYCGSAARPAERPMIELKREHPLESAQPPAASAPARACVPGATQTCTGPAGCSGGQACAADGSRFEPCDCGAPSAPPAPAQ